ncbi:hypothetical protein ACQP00_12855 [Dactylosporangium sp. CS-047395]|uniref:hypothetical protein n=1 Tax=Dactylosporangium sp. CS-047395 TaxID=3239936 RepID=UPI003D9453C3
MAEFETWILREDPSGPNTRTYICYADPTLALRAAFAAVSVSDGTNSIQVRLDGFSLYGVDLAGPNVQVFDAPTDAVRPFGVFSAVAGADIAEYGTTERLARALHASEREELLQSGSTGPHPSIVVWQQLADALRGDYVGRARS